MELRIKVRKANCDHLGVSGLASIGKDWRDEFDAPEGTAFIELSFFADKRGRLASKNPNVEVRGLLADQWRNNSHDAAEFHLDTEIRCFVANASDRKGGFALGRNEDVDQARFGGGSHHGETGGRTREVEVQQQNEGKTVANVGSEIKMVLDSFPVLIVKGDFAGCGFHQHIDG